MSTAAVINPIRLTRQDLFEQEEATFRHISGMAKLRHAAPDALPELEVKYPDATFALMICDNLFAGDREQNEIHLRAYAAILSGESIAAVRFRYDYDLESYLLRHMWD